MNLYKCSNGGGSSIEYIYKDGKWNSKYPKYSNSSMEGEGTFTYNSDGSFTWKGNARAGMGFKNLPTDKTLVVKFVPISNVNGLAIIVESTYRQYLADNINTTGSIYRFMGFPTTDTSLYLYIQGNNYSYKICEIFLI